MRSLCILCMLFVIARKWWGTILISLYDVFFKYGSLVSYAVNYFCELSVKSLFCVVLMSNYNWNIHVQLISRGKKTLYVRVTRLNRKS